MAAKKKAYTVSTKLQAVAVAEKTSKEAAASQFSIGPRKLCGGSVMLMASDNFHVAQIVRLLWTTTLPTAMYNRGKKFLEKTI